MPAIKNRRRKTKWDRTETELQGARDRTDHLLDRVSAIEHAIVRLHGVRCPCGSVEVVKYVDSGWDLPLDPPSISYTHGQVRCFYCHRLLEAYGVGG